MTIIKIDDEIGYWGISASSISRQLDEASGDITIEISSPGGVIFEGISSFNAIKSYNKGHVTTIITSLAASMASIIALAGDTVKAYDNSVYMIHNGSMGAWGDAAFLRKKADHIESLTKLMSNIYIAKSGNTEDEMKKLARRSVTAIQEIKDGEVFSPEHLGLRRPGNGLIAKEIEKIYGSKATRTIQKETQIKIGDFI